VLSKALGAAGMFCAANNVFRLRGEPRDGGYILLLPKLSAVFHRVLEPVTRYFRSFFLEDRVIRVSISGVAVALSTESRGLTVRVYTTAEKAYATGGSYAERYRFDFSLTSGREVNRIGFHVEQNPRWVSAQDFDTRLTIEQLRDLVSALFDDLTSLADELSREELTFDKEIVPALALILSALGKHQ
jgi:hypothetical protein